MGNVSAVSGDLQDSVDHNVGTATYAVYSTYGETISSTLPAGVIHGYRGYSSDDASGLLVAGARMYDKSVGSFTTEDPARMDGNYYSYCGGNPVSRWDPSGLCSITYTAMRDGYYNTGKVGNYYLTAGQSWTADDVGCAWAVSNYANWPKTQYGCKESIELCPTGKKLMSSYYNETIQIKLNDNIFYSDQFLMSFFKYFGVTWKYKDSITISETNWFQQNILGYHFKSKVSFEIMDGTGPFEITNKSIGAKFMNLSAKLESDWGAKLDYKQGITDEWAIYIGEKFDFLALTIWNYAALCYSPKGTNFAFKLECYIGQSYNNPMVKLFALSTQLAYVMVPGAILGQNFAALWEELQRAPKLIPGFNG